MIYKKVSRTVSRVLSWMVIYLGHLLPDASSNLPENLTGRQIVFCLVLLRMGFTYALPVTRKAVVSYTALPTLPTGIARRRYISVALSLESPPPDVIRHPALWSPDFPHLPKGSCDHLSYLHFYHGNPILSLMTLSYTLKQLPPTNSLTMELFGRFSLLTPKK